MIRVSGGKQAGRKNGRKNGRKKMDTCFHFHYRESTWDSSGPIGA